MKAAQKTRHTLGLAMIMKDEINDLNRIIKDYGRYFDKIYVTVTDKKTHTKLSKKYAETDGIIELSYFKWIDHFGKARIYNQQQVKTDYWMWIDLDDEIEGAENIPKILEYMVANNFDTVWFQYDYNPRVNFSDTGSILWRERIIKTASKLEWRDEAIHEDIIIQDDTKQESLSQVIIKHRKTAEQSLASGERNKLILEKDWRRTHRAVTASYLGSYLRIMGDYEGAIEKLTFVVEHSESKAQRFAAWLDLFECYFQTGQNVEALAAANESITIDSNHPNPWYKRFAVYWVIGDYDSAIQSAEIAMGKRVEGELALLIDHDPSWYRYKGPFVVARAYLSIGNVERAYQLYSEVKKFAPLYIEEQSTTEVQWSAVFENAHNDKHAAD